MRIKLIAKGRLKRVISDDIVNTGELEVSSPATLATVIEVLALPHNEAYAVILNNRMIPDSLLKTEPVVDGDEVNLIVPIRGG